MGSDTYGCADRPGDAAAYALGALDSTEASEFERHMESCVVCRDEALAFGHVTAALAAGVPQYAPTRRLRRRVLRDFRTAREPPPRKRVHTRPRWLTAPGPLAAAGVAALALATVGVISLTGSGTSTRTIRADRIGWNGSAELRVSGGQGQLVVHHMPAPAAGSIYEVWLKRGTSPPQPTTALFSVTSHGDGVVDVPGNLRAGTAVLVTSEPAGGTTVPTNPPVIVAHV